MSYRKSLAERLLRISFGLLRRPYTRQELVRELGVNAKTISRDIDTLSNELPVSSRRIGREVEYFFTEPTDFGLLQISPEEAATLLLAQESLAGIGITAEGSFYAGFAETLLVRIRKSLPVAIRRKMDALAKVYGSAVIPAKNFSRQTPFIDILTNCAIREKKVQIQYHGLNRNTVESRVIEPYCVYFDPDGATLKLIAYDGKKRRLSVFSIDRILNLEETAATFRKPADFDLKKYLDENCFNGIHGKPITVRLKVKGITARIFAERKFHPSQKVIKRKQKRGNSPETLTVEMRVADGRGLERFILGWLPDIEIISPPKLRESVKKTLLEGLKSF